MIFFIPIACVHGLLLLFLFHLESGYGLLASLMDFLFSFVFSFPIIL
jgi:hypothetical protein